VIEVTRLSKNRGGFERFPNEAARNLDLSLAALGLLARLLIDGNKFSSIAGVAEYYGSGKRGGGRDAYLEAAKELAAAGHLVRTQVRSADGRMTTIIAIYAESVNAQAGPTPAQPSPVPPAETLITPGQTDNGSAGVGASRQDDANAQVGPETAQAVPVPPAQTTVSAGRTENGSAVPLPYTDVFQTDRPPPTSSGPAVAIHASPRAAAGDGYAEQEPNPDADTVIDKLDLQRQPGRSERAQLLAPITAALAAGWTVPDLIATLDRDWTSANDRVRTAIYRAKDLGAPRRRDEGAGSSRPPWCGECHERTRMLEDPETRDPLGRCPRCHPAATEEPRRRTSATARALAEADAAGEKAKRIIAAGRGGGYQPYQNPTDQSVYLKGIA